MRALFACFWALAALRDSPCCGSALARLEVWDEGGGRRGDGARRVSAEDATAGTGEGRGPEAGSVRVMVEAFCVTLAGLVVGGGRFGATVHVLTGGPEGLGAVEAGLGGAVGAVEEAVDGLAAVAATLEEAGEGLPAIGEVPLTIDEMEVRLAVCGLRLEPDSACPIFFGVDLGNTPA